MFYIVYQITCLTTGKIYIGKHQTADINDGYMGSGKMLSRAIRKYGKSNFSKTILHVFTDSESMNLKEAELVTEEFCARSDTFNLCPGGHGGWGYVNQNKLNYVDGMNPQQLSNVKQKRIETIKQRYGDEYLKQTRAAGLAVYNTKHNVSNCMDIPAVKAKHKNSLPNDHQKGKSNSQFGKRFKFVNNGTEVRKVSVDSLQAYLDQGYVIGRLTT